MKIDIKEITQYDAIHCATKEESDRILDMLMVPVFIASEYEQDARLWWNKYKDKTCYVIGGKWGMSFTYIEYAQENNYDIYPSTDY